MKPGAAQNAVRGAALMAAAALLLAVWAIPVLLAVLTSFKNEKEVHLTEISHSG